ncbi:MAG: permease [Candidatus Hydrogenedentes bacterium]|nr:permease [Candidatus Hydrogenedentota bacterium]
MDWKKEWKSLAGLTAGFLLCFFLPLGWTRFDTSIMEALHLAKWYAREHVILCLLPAFFIAGAISVFLSQASVMKYLGAGANKGIAYGVASVSGTILAVCSCTVLPLFAGIWRMGAGLGPAIAFLYSGPAINILAIILTARILGPELGIARALFAIIFSIIIGLCMHFIYRREEQEKANEAAQLPTEEPVRPLWQTLLYFTMMIVILVFANWAKPLEDSGLWALLFSWKWGITSVAAILFGALLALWFGVKWWKIIAAAIPTTLVAFLLPQQPIVAFGTGIVSLTIITTSEKGELKEWGGASWGFAKQILPLLFAGVLAAGFLLGRPEHEGMIPSAWVAQLVGGNSLWANLFAAVVGAFMYFATLTEVPILQGLISSGMGKGPALALLLAGPALSLPNMLVIRSVLGTQKTLVYISLVVVMSTISGLLFGALYS